LLVYGGRIEKQWLAETWARCSEDESEEHIKAGTRVESLRSAEGAMFYASKYVGKLAEKDQVLPEYWEHVGQHWGYINKAKLPIAPVKNVLVSDLVASKMIGYMRERLQAYVRGKIAKKEECDEVDLEGRKVLEDWVIPKSMLGDPVEFLDEFTRWIQGRMVLDCIANCGGDEKTGMALYEKGWKRRIEREMDRIAKDFANGVETTKRKAS